MNPNTQECPSCHAPLQANDVFCPMCGASVPPPQTEESTGRQMQTPKPPPPVVSATTPPPVGATPIASAQAQTTGAFPSAPPPQPGPPAGQAPPVQPGYQPWQPQGGPAAVPPAAPAPGPGMPPPAYGAPPPAGYPPAYGTYPPVEPPKKKRNKSLIAIIIVVVLLLAAGGVALYMLYGPPAEARREAEVQEEYQTLLESICGEDSPEAIVAYSEELEDFAEDHPGVVDEDLEILVAACDEYEYGDHDDEDTFVSMLDTLEGLEDSDAKPVADCASTLNDAITEEYDALLARLAEEEAAAAAAEGDGDEDGGESDGALQGPPVDAPFPDPFPYELYSDFAVVDGNEYSYEFVNTSGKTIDYFDTWLFCYDENGLPMDGYSIDEDIYNMEWTYNTPYDGLGVDPGESYEAIGDFSNCEGTVYAVPFISFVRFTDGTYWGITDMTEDDGGYIADYYDTLAHIYDMQLAADNFAFGEIAA